MKNLHERGKGRQPLGVYSRGGPLFSSETHEPKTPSMGPQTQDLYVARGGSPTSILSNVHRESHRDPPWGKSSGGRVSGPGRVQHPPAKEPTPRKPRDTDLQQGTPKTWAQTRHNTKVERNRGGSVIGVTKKLNYLPAGIVGPKRGERVSGGGKREGEPRSRGVVHLASSHAASYRSDSHPVPDLRIKAHTVFSPASSTILGENRVSTVAMVASSGNVGGGYQSGDSLQSA